MNIAIWILQGILAAMFIMAGLMKATTPKQKLAEKMPWANDFSAGMIKFIGISQLLGALGLIIPMATGILPILTPIAAVGLALTMVFAGIYHFSKGEYKDIIKNVVLATPMIIVAVYRFQTL